MLVVYGETTPLVYWSAICMDCSTMCKGWGDGSPINIYYKKLSNIWVICDQDLIFCVQYKCWDKIYHIGVMKKNNDDMLT